MAKKTISDLLKQEVESQPKPVPDSPVVASPTTETDKLIQSPGEPLPQSPQSPDLVQIQAQLDTLKAALQQEKSLGEKLKQRLSDRQREDKQQSKAIETAQEKIKKLEQSLKQKQTQVKKLQDEVQLVEKLQTELTEEKNLVGKLYSKIQDLEEDLNPDPASSMVIASPNLPRAMPVRYVAPKQPPTNLSDEDIGWFD
jgi:DNA repair exonuclease SbcCD ATPase subunit